MHRCSKCGSHSQQTADGAAQLATDAGTVSNQAATLQTQLEALQASLANSGSGETSGPGHEPGCTVHPHTGWQYSDKR